MKARKSTKNRGRPRQEGYARTKSGRKSRSTDADTAAKNLALEAATWVRSRAHPGVDPIALAGPEYGSIVHAWREASKRTQERAPDKAHPNLFTAQHLDTANRLHKLYVAYRLAIASKSPRSTTDFGGVGGYDNSDPFDADRARRDAQTIEAYAGTITTDGKRNGGVRQAILESGPFGMMAVEAVIYENRDCPDMMADLRMALNNVDRLWQLKKAA